MKFGSPDVISVATEEEKKDEVIFQLPARWSRTSLCWQQVGCRVLDGGRRPLTPVPSALLPGREAALCMGENNKRATK